ncbi:type VII secretion-associated protein [Haloechinothrix sp. YIM 98757]|uniref:Type VII secretion-associated protein n=1 Tax=Haloechinothrix aidingensis TaxID=2752311 RepID=A0A838A6K7_9PSEU|nr:type VII secretion-associated protein [Haloechinothrix aidingensis]MBA0124758.1 type VII secretion-associated protein [Haloechinothrix aidingensis]
MSLRVAVDFGTSSTCVVASLDGREPQVVVIDGHPLLPSAVYAAQDGTLFVGREAERHAAVDPSRYEPHPKRRIDEGELLLGSAVIPVRDAVGAVLRRAVAEARRFAGDAAVDVLVLTHPADWGMMRTRVLRQSAGHLAREVALVPEPVAAAVFHAATHAPSHAGPAGYPRGDERTVTFRGRTVDALAVLDVGGGTVDVSVVQQDGSVGAARSAGESYGGFRVLATRGDPGFGGADIDQALLEHVGRSVSGSGPESWRELLEGRELATRRRRRVLRQDVRDAKETLSRHTYTDVPLPEPFPDAHVTRVDLERLITAPLGRAIEMTSSAIADARFRVGDLTGLFLVGGSSRIPLIARLVHERIGIMPTILDQPETVVARGALRAVLVEPGRRGSQGGTPSPPAGTAVPPDQQRTTVVGREDVPSRGRRPQAPPQVPPSVPAPAARQAMPAAAPVPQRGPEPPPPASDARPGPSPPARPSRIRRALPWLLGGGLAVATAAVAGAVLLLRNADPDGTTIARYDYRITAPAEWTQAGGDQERKQIILRPEGAEGSDDLIVVQQFDLRRDVGDGLDRVADEIEGLLEEAGDRYAEFDRDATYAGRDVIYYTEAGEQSETDWFVVVDGRVQVSVGCQYTDPGLERVESACEQVVRTLTITE